jgi:mono/diheme cytochrome c family protein/cytochrome c553
MRTKIKLLSFLFGTALLLGLPPVLLLTADLSPEPPPVPVAKPASPLRTLLAQRSTLELFYRDWQKGYLAAGGDQNVLVSLGWMGGLSTEPSAARGRVRLDLINGVLRAEVKGLDGPADLWLVDNQDGPGRTVQPEPGDRMVRVGRLQGGSAAKLAVRLGPELFRDFELDLVVVSRAGKTPAESSILLGGRPFFERLYTTTRLASARARAAARRPGFLSPAFLLSLLDPRAAEAGSSTQILIAHGLVSQAVGDGADLFFTGTFGGNGRTCATCHRAENNQGLDLDFISTLPANDRLFIAEFSTSQGGVPGLERPLLMRGHAQILENVDGLENPTVKFTMRGVPHTLSLATSILAPADGRAPVQRTGWSGDGAPNTGALRFFPIGAVRQHFTKSLNRVAGVDFVLPTDAQLDAMEAFMLSSGRLNELNLANVTLTDAGAQAGKIRFVAADARCNGCHTNAGANVANGQNFNFNTGVETAFDPSQVTEAHPHDGGFGGGTTPNFDCDGDGKLDCFGDGTFNVPPLIEAADTEPFFHNNNAATIEDAVTFFTTSAFANSPAGGGTPIPLSATDIANIGKFLRVLNAAFNVSISIQRNSAALDLENNSSSSVGCAPSEPCVVEDDVNGKRATVNMLLALSNSEATDAIEVLTDKSLHSDAVQLLNSAISKNSQAINETSSNRRLSLISGAFNDLNAAKAKFGTGLNFTLGEGNLLFPSTSSGPVAIE